MRTGTTLTKKIALTIVFSALGVVLSPFSWFMVFETKAYPAQHMINAILGVLLGPGWAALSAIFVGTIRNMLGLGTINAFPGGIPGGIVVGLVYWFLKRLKRSERICSAAALAEPIGTLLIGVPLALFLVAPLFGNQKLLDLTTQQGALFAFLVFGGGWALSCIPGSIVGFAIITILRKVGISREALFGKE